MKTGTRQSLFFRILILLMVCVFIFPGCSSKSSWFSFWNSSGSGTQVNEGQMKQFMAGVKPVQGDAASAYKLARHFQKQGRHAIAVEELLRAIQMDPTHYNAYNALGVSYDSLKRYDRAVEAYTTALRINPDLGYVYNNLGYSNLLQGNLEASKAAFEKALALDSGNRRYQNNLALVRARLGSEGLWETETVAEKADLKSGMNLTETEASLPMAGPQNLVAQEATGEAVQEDSYGVPDERATFYAVQVGAYMEYDRAKTHLEKMLDKGYDCPYITKVERTAPFKPYYRVRFGKFSDKKEADTISLAHVDSNGNPALSVEEFYPIDVFCADHGRNCADMTAQNSLTPSTPEPVEKDVRIEIANGNGVDRMARKVGIYLAGKGAQVDSVFNADHFHHPRTIIYYSPGYYGKAKEVMDMLPSGAADGVRLVESGSMEDRVQVLIGRDIVPFVNRFGKKGKNS